MDEDKTARLTPKNQHMRMTNWGGILNDTMKGMLQCSTEEVETIISMVDMHGIKVVEDTRDYVNNTSDMWSFGAFVVGTQKQVISRIRDRISPAMAKDLDEIVLDEEKYGRVNFYKDCDVAVADLFVDMCVNGTVEERIGELISYDVDFYGGRKDDVDIDKLLNGMAAMMERHGVTDDVRAKAKEFLTAVAMDTLNEVIHDE
jgi:hypothetical protein